MTEAFRSRLAVFALVLLVVLALELLRPRRRLGPSRLSRWKANASLLGLGVLVAAAAWGALSFTLVGLARLAEGGRIGLLHRVSWPFEAKFLLSFALLDLAVYLQHWAFHVFKPLWRLHRVHHTDLDMDVSTGVRFHPLEILVSLLVKVSVVVVFGCHWLAVAVFEAALNAASLFNHANLKLPLAFDRVLRLLMVTPDMHRIHHSARPGERDCNFGFTTPWWDRLFGTYEAQPHEPHTEMALGLPEHRGPETRSVYWLLKSPFLP